VHNHPFSRTLPCPRTLRHSSEETVPSATPCMKTVSVTSSVGEAVIPPRPLRLFTAQSGGSPCPLPEVTAGTRTAFPPKGASGDGSQSPEVPQCEAEEAKRLLLVNGDVRGQGTIGLGVLVPEVGHLLLGRCSHGDNAAKEEDRGAVGRWAAFYPCPLCQTTLRQLSLSQDARSWLTLSTAT